MARILFTWELGYRLHHLANVEVLARALQPEGHALGVALRELDHAPLLLSDLRLQYYQAPFAQPSSRRELLRYGCWAHVLHSVGFGDARLLQVLVSAWVGIFASFRPELIVFEHSPAALLASRAFDVRRVVVGSGFCVPPLGEPLGLLPDVASSADALQQMQRDEEQVLAATNRAGEPFGIAPLSRLAELYGQADASLALDVAELDVFGARSGMEYLGVWNGVRRPVAEWPDGSGARVLVYLSAFPGHLELLEALRALGAKVLIHSGNLPPELPRRLGADSLHFSDRLLDLAELAPHCDLFVSHASHASVCQTLLRGVPQLLLPIFKEQEYTAARVVALGAGRTLMPDETGYADALADLLAEPSYRDAAMRFAERHRDFDPSRSAARFREIVRGLVG